MSTQNYQKQTFSARQLELLHLNSICHDHDMWCACQQPLKHTAAIIFHHAKPTNFSAEETKEIKKCLGDTTGDEDLGGVTSEDLEKLFAEDTNGDDDPTTG